MALIVYPAQNWDTFIDIATADILIGGMAQNANTVEYLAMDDTAKEAILMQTALQIRLCKNITLPDDIESDLELAHAYLTAYAIGTDMVSYDPNGKAITYEKVGSLATAYQAGMKGSNQDFDPMTKSLLSQYGCSGGGSGFTQSTVSRV